MNKEEIWSKTRHFKIESDIGKLDLIDTDVYLDLLNKYDDLQHQLKEKDKAIDEAIKYAKNTKAVEYGKSFDTDGKEFYINEFWFIKDILEILEKGKNEK